MKRRLATPLALLAALAASVPGAAGAQSASESATAQALFDEAKALLAAGRPTEACPKLEESQRLDPGSGTLLNLARCYEEVGRNASAWGKYLEAASAAKGAGNPEREAVARQRATALELRLARLVIMVPAAARVSGLQVTRDGEAVGEPQWGLSIPTDAGAHVIAARAPGFVPWREATTVDAAASTTTVTVPTLAPATIVAAAAAGGVEGSADTGTARPPSGWTTQHTLGLTAAGLGLVGVGFGTVFGLQSKSHHDAAEGSCSGTSCTDQKGLNESNDARSAGNLATVGFIVGGVGLAAGAALWLTAPSLGGSGGSAATSIGLGPNEVRVRATF